MCVCVIVMLGARFVCVIVMLGVRCVCYCDVRR